MKEPETQLSDTSTPHLHQLLTVPGQDLTKSHLYIWLGSKLTQPATKSLQFIHERSLTEQQRQTFMLSSLEKSRTKSASPLEGSTLTPNLPSLAMFLKLELEKTISHTASLPFNLERSVTTVSQSENGRLVSTPQQVDLNRLTSTLSRVNGRQLAFDKTPVTYVSSPLYLYEDLPRVPLTHSGPLVTVLADDHTPKTHSVQITAGPLGDRPGSQTIDLSQKTQHTGAQSIASPSQVPLLSPISAKQSWQMESNMTLEPSLTQIPLAAPATSELYSEITSVPRTELYVDSVLFMMTPTMADFESNFDSSYSIPQATVEILGTTAHGQLWPIELSAVQRLYTESSLLLLQSLDPSYPQYTQFIAQEDPSYPQYIQSIAQENTLGNSTQTFPTDSLDFMSQSAEKEQTPLPSKFCDLEIRDHYSDPVYIQTDTSRQFSSESHKDRPQTAAITDKNSEYVSLQFLSKTNQLVTATSFSPLHSSQSLPSISVTTQTSSIPASVLSATNRSAVPSMHQSLPRTQGITSMGRAITVCPITGYCPLTSLLILSTGWREYDATSRVSSGPVEMREVSLGLAPTGVLRASSAPMSPSAASSGPSNLPPKVLQSIPLLEATVGFPFHYTIPSRTFLDPEDGAAESLSLELTFIDGPPVTLGSWVALDGLELHGVPLEVDLQFAPQQLLLAARDNQGLAAWLPLTLDLHRSHAEPCHSFSLIAHRSLYSLLSQRHRVELLLDKLSRFFNDSGSHHLAVLSLAPGSTIVSWYNFTLCQVGGDGDEGRCPVGQVWRMWEEISSEARQISPAFSQAMLPEFPISKVGPVSFRRDCFSSPTTATTIASSPTLSPSTPYPTSINTVPASDPTGASVRQTDPYHWMASVLTALLVVCCLFLAVTVTFIVFYFCRSHVRVRTLAIWPSEGVVPGHTMDLRAIRPRMPPLFQPEVPPPPPRLWLNTSPASGENLSPTYLQGRQPYQRPVSFHPPPQY
ncbi:mucin-3B-like [Oncorhynchus nerka]|uniref:mucin-3B-like n=1 Tax=Oncorhynchus nerka TaxID=8023 RepID=UPI0031B8811B